MSNPAYHTQILFDALRCLVLAGVTTMAGWILGARLPRTMGWRSWAIIVAPLCTPTLLVSYTYASLALHLTGNRTLLTIFYSALIALKLLPLGVIARRMFPSPISAEARFCEGLTPNRSFASRLAFRLRALGPVPWMTAGLAFLLAFTDFELASLLSIKTWTVMLFDAHAGGIALSESVDGASIPLCIEATVIFVLVFLARRASPGASVSKAATIASRWALPVMGAVAVVTSAWPLVKVVSQSLSGWTVIGVREIFGEDILVSLATAMVATVAVWLALAGVRRRATRLALVLPGLLGALVLSLALLAVLNAAPPDFLSNGIKRDWGNAFGSLVESPLPLVFAETLLLAPVAVLLWMILAMSRPGEKLHLARMAGSRQLIWELALEPRAAAFGLLFLLSYFEFTAASILAPTQLTPVCVRLHNLAHYGQTSALSAMLIAAMFAPAAVLALTLGAGRFYARKDAR
jgi:ABC-type Fe3+ transport system permease subunit